MTTIQTMTVKIVDLLSNVAKADAAQARAAEKTAGAYTQVVRLAAESDHGTFRGAIEAVAELVTRDGKLARALKAPKRAKPSKDGAQWKVPGSLKTAKSVILSAFDHGVDLLDPESGEVRSFGAIRKDVRTAAAAAKAESLTGDALIRSECAAYVARIMAAVAKLEGDALDAIANDLSATANIAEHNAAEDAAAAADAEADAA